MLPKGWQPIGPISLSRGTLLSTCIVGRSLRMQLKKVLSSIPEAPLSVECLMNDIDFRSSMSREKMEELAAPFLERTRTPLAQARRPSLQAGNQMLLSWAV